MNRTLIISGGYFDKEYLRNFLDKKDYSFIIAADKGTLYAKKLEIIPNLIVGDFDSAEKIPEKFKNIPVLHFDAEKDDTDTEIAMKEAVKKGHDIDIICGTGGRIDHLLGNIHILKYAADTGLDAVLIDPYNMIMLRNASFKLNKNECKKYISFIPFEGTVKGLKLKGFKYELENYDLKPGITRCISNEIIEETAYIEFESGSLIVVSSSDN